MTRFGNLGGVLIIIAILISISPSLLRREREWRRMQVDRAVFFEWIKITTAKLDDSDKVEFYEELLETGSASIKIDNVSELDLAIGNSFEIEVIFNKQKISEEETQETIDDIDFIIGMDDDELFDELDDQPDGE